MEAVNCSSSFGDCNRDMERLCEAFGSSFSLEAIASAYSQASRDVDLAGLILYESQGTTSEMSHESKDELDSTSIFSSESTSGGASHSSHTALENVTGLLSNNIISSGVLGEEYVCPTLSSDGFSRSQPSEVDSNESVAPSCNSIGKDDNSMHKDVEVFLFEMLGEGFQLDMKVIHEVLGLCGYDLEKSMETLVDLSAATLEKSDDVVSITAERVSQERYLKIGSNSCPEKSQLIDSSLRSPNQNGKEPRKINKDKYDMEREILGALFTAPEREEERPKRTNLRTGVRRSSTFGRYIAEPLKETKIEQTFVEVKPLGDAKEAEGEEDENSFSGLRQAVKEYRDIMKEYYKAAAEAYTKGDEVRAYKLMKEGQFYNKKAREADEKSAQKLLETREEEMLLDLSTHEPKEAIKLLRLHLSNLAGIPTIPYLRVAVGNDDGETKRGGGGPKRLVVKLLEKESIKWTEAENGSQIVIRLDEINPKRLSFAKK